MSTRAGASDALGEAAKYAWHWWMAGLRDVTPARWRRVAFAGAPHITVVVGFGKIEVSASGPEQTMEATTPSYSFDDTEASETTLVPVLRGAGRLTVQVRAGGYLAKRLWLPLAAKTELNKVLAFEVSRHTPFQANDVYLHASIRDEDPTQARILVDWVVIPKQVLARVVPALSRAEIARATLEPAPGESVQFRIPLILSSPRNRLRTLDGRVWALAVLFTALLLSTIAAPFAIKLRTLSRMESELAALIHQAQIASEARERNDLRRQRESWVIARSQRRPAVLEVLKQLAERLTHETRLKQLDLDGDHLAIRGTSTAPSQLVGLLGASPLFAEVAFQSALRSTAANGQTEFDLTLKVVNHE